MEKVSVQELFEYNKKRNLIRRNLIKPSRTLLLVFLDQNKKLARRQLKFNWKGLIETVMVLGAGSNTINKADIIRSLAESGTGTLPRYYYVDAQRHNDTNSQVMWVVENLKGRSVDNIIINSFLKIEEPFYGRLHMALPRPLDGSPISFYQAKEIEQARL